VGMPASRELSRDYHVKLIDRKPYFENIIGLYDCMAKPAMFRQNRANYSGLLANTEIIVTSVKGVNTDRQIVFAEDGPIPYDHLVSFQHNTTPVVGFDARS
jgi:NADH dehydrogenase FAD-containing subunit